jgi:putative inorganic carbon (HCO3(-)) transporter
MLHGSRITFHVLRFTFWWEQVSLPLAVTAAGVLLALLPLAWAGLLVGGVVLGLALVVWPGLGLLLLPLAVPFGSLREVSLVGLNASATEALLAATLAAWIARMLATRRLDFGRPVLLLPLLGFIGAIFVSLTQATALPPAAKETIKWLEVVAVYLAVCGLVRSRRQVTLLLGALLLAGSAEALLGIGMALQRSGPPAFAILGGRLYRAYGTFGQPNPFGGYMNMVWPLAASLVLSRLLPSAENRKQKMSNYLLFTAYCLLPAVVLALVLSWSRGAWLGAAAGAVVLVVGWFVTVLLDRADDLVVRRLRRRVVGWIAIGMVLALLVILGGAFNLIPASVTGRLQSAAAYFGGFDPTVVEVTDENFATVERVAHWWAARGMWADHPWLGVGIGNYAVEYSRYNIPRWTDPLGHAHNYYLNVGAETGLLGFVMYLVFLTSAFLYAARVAWRRRDGLSRAIAIAALGVLTATAVHNFFDNLYVHDMAVQISLILGLVSAADYRPRESWWSAVCRRPSSL